MKTIKIFGTALFAAFIISGCSNKGYKIEGAIAGDANGKKVFLYSDAGNKPVDSLVIENNKFTFKGEVEYPALYKIKIIKNPPPEPNARRMVYQPVIPFFIENAVISISANLDSIPDEYKSRVNSYTYKDIKIEGSALNGLYLTYSAKKKVYDSKRSDIVDEYIRYLNPSQGETKGKISQGVEIVTRVDQAAAERDAFVKQFVKENNNNYIGLYSAYNALGSFSVSDIDELLATINPELLLSKPGVKFIERANEVKKTAVGSKFFDLDLVDHKGNSVKLSDYVGKGKYVLLEFWASWCGPCTADIPHLKEVYKLYNPEGFQIVSVSLDDNKEAWIKGIEEFKLEWTQVSDLKAFKGDVAKIYGIAGVPTCILTGPDGNIITRNMRGSWMDKKLIVLYGNKFGKEY